MRERLPIHPGEILQEDFMKPLGITQYALAQHLGVQQTRVSQIIHGKRGITPDTAVRLAVAFSTTPQFWLNLQSQYDLEAVEAAVGRIEREVKPFDLSRTA